MRPGPQIDLVLVYLGEGSGLEGVGVVGGHVQPGGMVATVNPILAIGLVTLDGTDVVGLAVVVPGDDLDYVNLVAVVDDGLPTLVVQVVVRHVDPLKTTPGSEKNVVKFLWDTYVFVEGIGSVVGEEPRGNSGHVGLGIILHASQTTQPDFVRLNGTNEVVESRGVETSSISETSTKGLEDTCGFLGGQLDRPTRVPVVTTVNDVVKVLEGAWVDEERGNEVDFVISGELINELGLPAVDGGTGAESAGVSGEGGGEDITVVPQLVGMVCVACDVVTERTGVLRGGAWHHTASRSS